MDTNVTIPDRDPSSDGDETGKGEGEWDNVSADVMRRICLEEAEIFTTFRTRIRDYYYRGTYRPCLPTHGGETSATSYLPG